MSFAPSIYQARIFDFVQRGVGSAIVDAVAGSGKTTTMVKALELIPPTAKVLFLAFNKKIATELQARVPRHVKAATFHSVGFAAWKRLRDSAQIDSNKVRDLLKKNFSQMELEVFGGLVPRLVSMAKSAGIGALLEDKTQSWLDLAAHHDHDLELSDDPDTRSRTISAAQRVLKLSVEQAMQEEGSVIDFDDMLYMPLIKDAPFYRYDWLLVDESQDTNSVQLALLRRMLKPGGRLIAVGDPRQAIYGFRGADSQAMANIKTAFNCCELPLTISYRCAQSVVRLAQTIVPKIEAAPTAPEGKVIDLQGLAITKFNPSDVIICRNTAPIVELAYTLIGKGIGCVVLGREIGQALADVVKKMKADSLDVLLVRLEEFAAREIAKFSSKGQEQKAEAVRDKVDCIKAIASHLGETERNVSALLASISRIFSDEQNARLLTLCTAHKSKGLEWDRVYIYRPELMPSKWARQAWQQEQERNLQYVAWTRAKRELIFLTEGPAVEVKPAPVIAPKQENVLIYEGCCYPIVPGHTANHPDDFWVDFSD